MEKDINVSAIYRFVDLVCEAWGEPNASAATREKLAEQVAGDLNQAGIYVEPS